MPKLKVNKTKCIGCGVCVSLYPHLFALGADGKSGVIDSAKEVSEEEAKKIVAACPMGAIEKEE